MHDATHPVHRLLDRLLDERLSAIEALAAGETSGANDQMRSLADLQQVIVAVREEISRHEVKVGHGSEQILA